jgi:CRP-like cAMP-binding protein
MTRLAGDEKVLDAPQLLRNVDLLAGLETEDLWRVGRATTARAVPAGSYLCRQGERGDELYVIVAGEVEVVDESGDEPRVTFVATPGMVVGEIAVLADIPRIASLRCRTDTELLVLAGADFRTLMHELPSVSTRIIETLVRRLVGV